MNEQKEVLMLKIVEDLDLQNKTLDIQEKIVDIVRTNLCLKEKSFDIKKSFKEFQMDSIIFIKIIVSIEKTFGFEVEDEYLYIEKLPTTEEIILYVKKRLL